MAIVGQEVNSPDTGITLRTGNDSEDDQVGYEGKPFRLRVVYMIRLSWTTISC